MTSFHHNLQNLFLLFLLLFVFQSEAQGKSRAVQFLYRRTPWRSYGSPSAGILGGISTEKGDLSYRSSRAPQVPLLVYPIIPVDARTPRDASYWNSYNSNCEYACDDGTCITQAMKCNGFANCWDGSDEKNCSCSQRLTEAKICDGYKDCPDGSDEDNCVYGCTADEFTCDKVNSGSRVKCIPKSKRCDGYNDCPLKNDEEDCFRLVDLYDQYEKGVKSKGILQKRVGDGDWHTVCKTYTSARYITGFAEKACEQIVGELDGETVFVQSKSLGMIKQQMQREHVEQLKYLRLADVEANFAVLGSCELVYDVTCPTPMCGGTGNKKQGYLRRRRRETETEDMDELMELMQEDLEDEVDTEADTEEKDTGMIVGGYATKEMEWPYIIGIIRDGEFYCGGSLINDRWVMTAAHCCHNYEKHTYEVQAGMTRRLSWSPYEQTRQVEEIHVHEGYSSRVFANDIALFKLDKPLYLSKYVTPACMPTGKSDDPVGGDNCVVAGWGDLSESGNGPDHMQQVQLPVLDKCKESFTRDEYQICAGYMPGGKDACQGDSGGPFTCTGYSGKPTVNGVVSFGRGCARANEAGAYTRVSAYLDWINKVTSGENYNASSPRPKTCTETCYKPGGSCLFPHEKCSGSVECLYGEDESVCSHLVSRSHADYSMPPVAPPGNMLPYWATYPQKPLLPLPPPPPPYNMASRTRFNYEQPGFFPFLHYPPLPPPPNMFPLPNMISSNTASYPSTPSSPPMDYLNPRANSRSSRTVMGTCDPSTEFECTSKKSNQQLTQCVQNTSRCNRVPQCDDSSDEANCVAVTTNFKDHQLPSSSANELKGFILTRFENNEFLPAVSRSWSLARGQEACNSLMKSDSAQLQSLEIISIQELAAQMQRTRGANPISDSAIEMFDESSSLASNGQVGNVQRNSGKVQIFGSAGNFHKINVKNIQSLNSNDDNVLSVGFVRCKK